MRLFRIALVILGILIALTWGGARLMSQDLPQHLAAWMSSALGRPVTMAEATIRLLPLSIQVSTLRVAGLTPQDTPVLQVADISARLHLPALLSGHIVVREVRLDSAHVFLHRTAEGGHNLPRIFPSPSSTLPPPACASVLQLPDITWQIDHLTATNGQVDIRDDTTNRTARIHGLQLTAGPMAPNAPIALTLHTSWQVQEAQGTLQIHGTTHPKPLRLEIPHLMASITAPQGEIPSLRGRFDVTLEPGNTTAGPTRAWGANIRGTSALAAEKIRLGSVLVPRAETEVSARDGRIHVSRLSATLAQGEVHLHGEIDTRGPHLTTHLQAHARDLDLAQIFAMLQAPPRIRGTAAGNATLQAKGNDMDALQKSLSGEVRLRLTNGAVRGVPLGKALRTAAPLLVSPTLPERPDVAFTELAAQGPVQRGEFVADITGHGPWFTVAGGGKVLLPQKRIAVDLGVTATAQAARELGPLAAMAQAAPIPIQVRGTMDAPEVRVDLQRLLRQTHPQTIERIFQNPRELLQKMLP